MGTKVTALSALSVVAGEDLFYVVDDPSGTPASRKIPASYVGGLLCRNAVGGRLTLTTGVPVTTADVTNATTVYFTPYSGSLYCGLVSLYDGTRWQLYTFSEISLALGTLTAALPYDVFLYDNAGTLTLEFTAWTSATARATALTTQDGIYVKTGATTRRYLGTFYTSSTTQTQDNVLQRFLWNYYNRVPRLFIRAESTTWAYTLTTVRQANNSSANQVEGVIGVAEVLVQINLMCATKSDAAASSGRWAQIGIGEDATNAYDANNMHITSQPPLANADRLVHAFFRKYPAVGYHKWCWNESAGAVGTNTFVANDGKNLFGHVDG